MPDIPVKVVALALREQGLIVKRGNPKGIKNISDLSRSTIRFVNRQRGAGTWVLLDYHLKFNGDFSRNDFKGTIKKNILTLELRQRSLRVVQIADFVLQPRHRLLIWNLSHCFKSVMILSFRKNMRMIICWRLSSDFWAAALCERLYLS